MVIDITDLIVNRSIGWQNLLDWLNDHAGEYYGKAIGWPAYQSSIPEYRKDVLEIGKGWQIYGISETADQSVSITYQLDIDNTKAATFFVLKWI